jgi:hypothetical protein
MYFTLEQTDRAIFETIRTELVAQGYTPDITVHTTEIAYNTALQAIKTAGKQPVNIYGVGEWRAKKELKYNTIIIERVNRTLSNLGYHGEVYYELNGSNKYDKKQTPYETVQLAYNVTMVCDNTQNERILQGILYNALDAVKTLKGVNGNGTETDNTFLLFRQDIINQSGADFIEYIFRYNTSEVFLEIDKIIEADLPRILQTQFETIPTNQIYGFE